MGRTNNSNSEGMTAGTASHVLQQDRRRRRRAVGVEDFAHRKGVTKAIEDFRKRKDKKRTETAKALRKYKKTMKQEGYEPGRGASRKRQHGEESAENYAEKDKKKNSPEQEAGEDKTQTTRPNKKAKTNPFQKSLQKAEQKKQQIEKAKVDKEKQEKEREKKIKEKRKRSKLLRQRTSKGQPVMKHVIHDILRKLEKEKQDEQS
jgi:hypothetical protein